MSEEKKLEYQELRDEFALLNQMIATTVNFSVGGCIAIFGFLLKSFEGNSSVWLFLLPLLIIYPSCLLIASRFQASHRISAYLIVFIEPDSDLKFQTRLRKCGRRHWHWLQYRKMILWIFFSLILFDVAIFAFNGFTQNIHFVLYLTSILFFIVIYRIMGKGWISYYLKEWEGVKEGEKQQ